MVIVGQSHGMKRSTILYWLIQRHIYTWSSGGSHDSISNFDSSITISKMWAKKRVEIYSLFGLLCCICSTYYSILCLVGSAIRFFKVLLRSNRSGSDASFYKQWNILLCSLLDSVSSIEINICLRCPDERGFIDIEQSTMQIDIL